MAEDLRHLKAALRCFTARIFLVWFKCDGQTAEGELERVSVGGAGDKRESEPLPASCADVTKCGAQLLGSL